MERIGDMTTYNVFHTMIVRRRDTGDFIHAMVRIIQHKLTLYTLW